MMIRDFPQGWLFARLFANVFGALLAAITAPLICELLALSIASRLPRRTRSASLPGLTPLKLICIVPAHNEELLVGRCVRSLTAAMPADCEVLVIAHRCSDQTAERARHAGALVVALEGAPSGGKGEALRFGFAEAVKRGAGAGAVVVVDADSVVSPGFLRSVQASLGGGAEAVQGRYTMSGIDSRDPRTRLAALAFQGFNVIRPRGRERLGFSAGLFGNGFGLRAEVLERVPYQAMSLVEDLEYHLALVNSGVRVRFLEDAAVWSEMPAGARGSKSQRTRWEGGRIRMMRLHAPHLLRGVLSRKYRLIEPLLDTLSLPLGNVAGLLALLLCLPIPWLRIYALVACAAIAFHVMVAASEGGGLLAGLRTLVYVPQYIVWKLWLLPQTLLASRTDAAWVRTKRVAEDPNFPEKNRLERDSATKGPGLAGTIGKQELEMRLARAAAVQRR